MIGLCINQLRLRILCTVCTYKNKHKNWTTATRGGFLVLCRAWQFVFPHAGNRQRKSWNTETKAASCLISALVYCNKNLWIQSTFTGTAGGHWAALFDSYSKPVLTTNIQTHTPFYNFIFHQHTVIILNKHCCTYIQIIQAFICSILICY